MDIDFYTLLTHTPTKFQDIRIDDLFIVVGVEEKRLVTKIEDNYLFFKNVHNDAMYSHIRESQWKDYVDGFNIRKYYRRTKFETRPPNDPHDLTPGDIFYYRLGDKESKRTFHSITGQFIQTYEGGTLCAIEGWSGVVKTRITRFYSSNVYDQSNKYIDCIFTI